MIFRNNINQAYNNQFQTGTEKLNIKKQSYRKSYTILSSKGKGMLG